MLINQSPNEKQVVGVGVRQGVMFKCSVVKSVYEVMMRMMMLVDREAEIAVNVLFTV